MSPQVDPVQVYGIKRLRREYFERNPGGDFKAFLERFDALRQAVRGQHKPVRFYGLTFGHPGGHVRSAAAEGAGGARAARAVEGTAVASLPQDEAGQLSLLKRAGLVDPGTGTLAEALREIELPFMFAGREQWVRNLTRSGDEVVDPALRNVSMESPLSDPNALRLLLGRARTAVNQGRDLAGDVSMWKGLVPEWAERVRDELSAQGVPFSIELLASPEINLHDAAKPLFEAGAHPKSLVGLGVDQAGEGAFLRSLSAEELLTQVWPLYWQYNHRAAGAPVPPGFEAGLSFGSPVQRSDGTFVRSPIMQTEAYKRWAALGFPGDPTQNGLVRGAFGSSYNPLLGTGEPGRGTGTLAASMASGALRPEHLFPFVPDWAPNRDLVISGLGVVGAAAFLQDPSVYFSGPREPYNPIYLDEATKSRLMALMGVEQPAAAAA
jgi:hypothetical protein